VLTQKRQYTYRRLSLFEQSLSLGRLCLFGIDTRLYASPCSHKDSTATPVRYIKLARLLQMLYIIYCEYQPVNIALISFQPIVY